MTIAIHRIEEPRSEHEQELYRMLHELKMRYELEAKPIIDALVQFESCKTTRYFLMASDAQASGLPDK